MRCVNDLAASVRDCIPEISCFCVFCRSVLHLRALVPVSCRGRGECVARIQKSASTVLKDIWRCGWCACASTVRLFLRRLSHGHTQLWQPALALPNTDFVNFFKVRRARRKALPGREAFRESRERSVGEILINSPLTLGALRRSRERRLALIKCNKCT